MIRSDEAYRLILVRRVRALGVFTALIFGGCTTGDQFNLLYDYYFPQRSQYVTTRYRDHYDKVLFGPPPSPNSVRAADRKLYFAFHSDSAAFHDFLHDPDREGEGEFSETWVYDCVLLLLRLGDDRFSELLSSEDHATREAVGFAVDSQIDWNKHRFPKTRALYTYRYVRPQRRV